MIDTNNSTYYVVIKKTLIGPITTDEDNTANLQVELYNSYYKGHDINDES